MKLYISIRHNKKKSSLFCHTKIELKGITIQNLIGRKSKDVLVKTSSLKNPFGASIT